MGARAYLIKKVSDSSYRYMYAHNGAGKFKQLTEQYYHSDQEITDEDIENRFNEIWEHSESKGEEIQTATSLDEIVDVEDICIEAYIIEDQNGEYDIILPTITTEVNVAVTRPIKSIPELHRVRNLQRKVADYIQVAEEQGLEEDTIREGARAAVSRYRSNGYTQLIEEDENPENKVFNRISKVIA